MIPCIFTFVTSTYVWAFGGLDNAMSSVAARPFCFPNKQTTPLAPGDDAMFSVVAQVCQRKKCSCEDVIIPHHPARPSRILRRCYGDCGRMCDIVFVSESRRWWLRNRLFKFVKSLLFGCGIGFFGCGIVFFWLWKSAEIWLQKYQRMVSESEFIPK